MKRADKRLRLTRTDIAVLVPKDLKRVAGGGHGDGCAPGICGSPGFNHEDANRPTRLCAGI